MPENSLSSGAFADSARTRPVTCGRRAGVIVLVAMLALGGGVAWAHALGEPEPAIGSGWSFDAWVVICLALSGALYAVGLARLSLRAGRRRAIPLAPSAAFTGGWLVIAAALMSPIDALGAALFSAHMLQHELLMLVAAPLMVLGRPLAIWTWALPPTWRVALGRAFHRPAWRVPWLAITAPISAWTLHALAIFLWHVPALFDTALASEDVHALQHVAFLGTALLFWWSILGSVTRRDRGVALLSLFTTMAYTGALGALLTLSTSPWYPDYGARALSFGLTALQDQQLGGLVMWVPTGFVYIACGLLLARQWLAESPAPLVRGRGAT